MKDLNYFKKLHEAKDDTEGFTDEEIEGEETSDNTNKEETDEDETQEENFIKMFDDESFVDAFKVETKQYISEKLLEDEFNSFTILPYVEMNFKDDVYGVSVEFESAVTINVNDEGDVVEKDIPEIEIIKFKTPEMDNVTVMNDDIGKESISMYVTEAIDEIKKVPR